MRPVLFKVGFLAENPQDPESYVEGGQRAAEAWERSFVLGLGRVEEVQEGLQDEGVPLRSGAVWPRKDKAYDDRHQHGDARAAERCSRRRIGQRGKTLEERMAASQKWAAWAPGMKKAIAMAVRMGLEQVKLKGLSAEQWKAHLANDHLPFHRGCRTCLEGAGKARYHRTLRVTRWRLTWQGPSNLDEIKKVWDDISSSAPTRFR